MQTLNGKRAIHFKIKNVHIFRSRLSVIKSRIQCARIIGVTLLVSSLSASTLFSPDRPGTIENKKSLQLLKAEGPLNKK